MQMPDQNLKVRSIRSAVALPVIVLIVLPTLILLQTDTFHPGWGLDWPLAVLIGLFGAALITIGLTLLVSTIKLFAGVGDGTLAPWDPPKRLVVVGPYRYVRNPMHSGVFMTLFGEAALTGSITLLWIAALIFVFHWGYIPLFEERWLKQKFGEDYLVYKKNVRAWIPRLKPWEPE
jgi:protein-S-isoprenylcysteine O-methyltransferase Ste14